MRSLFSHFDDVTLIALSSGVLTFSQTGDRITISAPYYDPTSASGYWAGTIFWFRLFHLMRWRYCVRRVSSILLPMRDAHRLAYSTAQGSQVTRPPWSSTKRALVTSQSLAHSLPQRCLEVFTSQRFPSTTPSALRQYSSQAAAASYHLAAAMTCLRAAMFTCRALPCTTTSAI